MAQKRIKKKVVQTPASIDDYLDRLSTEKRATLEDLRKTIRSAAPGATEYISYGVPAFRLNDRLLVAFAAATKHSSFYPGAFPLAKYKEEIKDYDTSKGTIRFPWDQRLPHALIRKLVKARVEEQSKHTKK